MTKKILSDLVSPDSPPFEVSLLFTGDSEIRRLNKNFRGKDKATDVLSFPAPDGDFELEISDSEMLLIVPLGDIAISVDTMLRQAKELKVNPYQELLRLLIHGLLHLLGFEHENVSKKAADYMKATEDALYRLHVKHSSEMVGK